MLGDLAPIVRDYLLDDYRADTANYDVVSSVHIEAVPADPIAETRWLQATANSEGLPSAIVARVELHEPDVEKVIAEHQELSETSAASARSSTGTRTRNTLSPTTTS